MEAEALRQAEVVPDTDRVAKAHSVGEGDVETEVEEDCEWDEVEQGVAESYPAAAGSTVPTARCRCTSRRRLPLGPPPAATVAAAAAAVLLLLEEGEACWEGGRPSPPPAAAATTPPAALP